MKILLPIAFIICVIYILYEGLKSTNATTQQQQKEPEPPKRPPLTDAEREAILQADEAFDWRTHNAIVSGTYKGRLPEHIVANHWTQLYPDLYHTKIAGINFRRGIKDLAGVYFDAVLVADTKNKYDHNAIKILHAQDKRHLGFIPADETDDVRAWVNNKLPYPCRAHIEEFEEWDDEKERDVTRLYGEINIRKPTKN